MVQKRPAKLSPGFLDIRETKGIIFLISQEESRLLEAIMLQVQRIIYGKFEVACTVVILYEPEEQLPEKRERDIRGWDGFFRSNGTADQSAMYINLPNCHESTIRFTESLGMKTLHLKLEDFSLPAEEIARKAIVEILKAIR